ncbi:MAG: FAD:protein FMN transferase [Myxococcota bacterium]
MVLGLGLGGVGCQAWPGRSAGDSAPRVVVSDGWLAMGTFFDVDLRVAPEEVSAAETWLSWAREELARREKIYSRYDPESQLSALNQALAGEKLVDDAEEISAELALLIDRAFGVWAETGGAFDPTVGPLIEAWDQAARRDEWPSSAALRSAKARTGANLLVLNPNLNVNAGLASERVPNRIRAKASGLRLDLDGISKGAVLDHLGDSFRHSFPNAAALFSFGESSLLAVGDPDGGGWRLGVNSRDPAVGVLALLSLRDRALSISSSVGSVRVIQGESVSHIVDARTGSVVVGVAEAVVIGESAADADAWSTALLVLGARKDTIRMVERAGLDAYIFEQTGGRTVSSENWSDFIAQ